MRKIFKVFAASILAGFGAVCGIAAYAGLESVTHISDLNSSWPLGSDLASTTDDHIRNIKVALKTDFPSITGPVTVTQAQLNAVGASGVTGSANPSASLGLTAVNGSATTFMRSDGAPALSQAIAPTWTGTHTFSNGTQIVLNNSGNGVDAKNTTVRVSGGFGISSATDAAPTTPVTNALNFTRTGSAWTTLAFGNATDNPTYTFAGTGKLTLGTVANPTAPGLNIGGSSPTLRMQDSGANGSIIDLAVTNTKASVVANFVTSAIPFAINVNLVDRLNITTAGQVQLYEPSFGVAALANSATVSTGSFTGTLTGMTGSVTGTVNYSRVGQMVTLMLPTMTGTSNSTAMTMTGIPAGLSPTRLQRGVCSGVEDNGTVNLVCSWNIAASGTTLFFGTVSGTPAATGSFTASGTKGIDANGTTIIYSTG